MVSLLNDISDDISARVADDWQRKVLIHGNNTILIPSCTKILLKRIKEIDMGKGICILNYT